MIDQQQHRSERALLQSMSVEEARRIKRDVEDPCDCSGTVQRESPVTPALYIAALTRLWRVDRLGVVDVVKGRPSATGEQRGASR